MRGTGWKNGNGASDALTLEVGRSSDAYNLTLRGVLDLSTADRFEAAMDAALVSDAARVSVDLDGLEFIDSTGLAAILRATGEPTATDA